MSELPPTDMESWGRGGTVGGPHASFFRRYVGPLSRLAMRRFPQVDAALAQDLAQGYCVRELERDLAGTPPVFELFDPHLGTRFRSLLTRCFLRYCRDVLEKEARRRGLPVEESSAAVEDGLDRLVARDLLQAIRDAVLASVPPDARRYAELKLPTDEGAGPSDRELARRLGVSRQTVAAWRAALVQGLAVQVRRVLEEERGGAGPVEDVVVIAVVEALLS